MSRNTVITIAAAALILTAGIGYVMAYQSARNTVKVMVSTHQLSPFVPVLAKDLTAVDVPKGSVGDNDLTESEYKDTYVKPADDGTITPLVPLITVLDGDRLDKRAIAQQELGNFGIVLPDERVVAVTATAAGAGLGVIQPGDIVDVSVGGGGANGGSVSRYAKVLCISDKADGCESVIGAGQGSSKAAVSGASRNNGSGDIHILLAVDRNDESSLTGQDVSLALNTFCTVDDRGYFASVRSDFPCEVPQGRVGSQSATKKTAKKAAAKKTK